MEQKIYKFQVFIDGTEHKRIKEPIKMITKINIIYIKIYIKILNLKKK
jgi:hypothetical protein